MNRSIFTKLVRLHMLTPSGIYRMAECFVHDGITLMALLRFSAHYYPDRTALVADGKRLSYKEMYECANRLARILFSDYGLTAGDSVGLLCRNHLIGTLLLPALSRLGVKIKLISTDMAPLQINDLADRHKLRVLIHDPELKNVRVTGDSLPCEVIETSGLFRQLTDTVSTDGVTLPHIKRGGEISVFTGGTSGKHKEASRPMSVFQFLPPLFALLEKIRIDEYDSVLLPLPVYHGFGLATLIISLLMGKKICLMGNFDAGKALQTISEEQIAVLPVIPAMLARLWQAGDAPEMMKSLRCIICGGDRLDRKWVTVTNKHLGPIIHNLYGTSEAGFFLLASPDDLSRYDEVPIGRPINGVKCRIEQADIDGTGSLWVRSGWAMIGFRGKWQDTGDLVCRNAEGCYFYRGRKDNMVVCGGENVYPENVERVINSHPEVMNSIVYPVPDTSFGTVLNARIELIPGADLTPDQFKTWLRPQLSRAELPHQISVAPINLLETGKRTRQ